MVDFSLILQLININLTAINTRYFNMTVNQRYRIKYTNKLLENYIFIF